MNPFTYRRATAPADAVSAVAGQANARFLAGGTNLIDLMKMGVVSPDQLIDLKRVPLAQIEESGDKLRLGAMARNSEVADHALVKQRFPVLAQALLAGASPQLRNLATVGGNLLQRTRCPYFYDPAFPACNKRQPGSGCGAIEGDHRNHAILGHSPRCIATHPSDMCVALAVLDPEIRVMGPGGERVISYADFHRLPEDRPETDTTLAADELITAVDLPYLPPGSRSAYLKVRDRASYAFALVSVATVLEMAEGRIRSVRLALGGVAHKPWRARQAEALLVGVAVADVAALRAAATAELADARGFPQNEFKIELARRCLVRAIQDAAT